MKKAYIWACIWVLIILAPIILVYGMYKPVDEKMLDIVKIGVILPFMASSTLPADIVSASSATAYEIMNGLEAVPKRSLVPGAAPALVFIFEDSGGDEYGDEARARASVEKLIMEAGVSAIILGPSADQSSTTNSINEALVRAADAAHVPLMPISAFSGSTFGCGPEGLTDIGSGEAEALSDFCATYQKQHKATPTYFAAYAFDLGNILMRALDMQRSEADTREAISKAVSAHKYSGITGAILLNSKGKRI